MKTILEKMSLVPPKNMANEKMQSWFLAVETHNRSVDYFNNLSEEEQERGSKFCTPMKCKTHEEMMQFGIDQGWWEEFDHVGPIRRWIVDINVAKFWSQLLTKLGFFKTVGEAKRHGFVHEINEGTFHHFKGREKFIIGNFY